MALPVHLPIIGWTTRLIVLRHFALRVHPEPSNDNERTA